MGMYDDAMEAQFAPERSCSRCSMAWNPEEMPSGEGCPKCGKRGNRGSFDEDLQEIHTHATTQAEPEDAEGGE